MKEYNCPVCNKAGLPDFRNQSTVCPQCNSDLKPYLVLHSKVANKPKRIILALASSLVVITCLIVFQHFHSSKESQRVLTENSKQINSLHDTLSILKSGIDSMKRDIVSNRNGYKEVSVIYKVKEGDCISKIAEFFYNDWRNYKKIEKENNLKEPYILKIGQTLNVKLKGK